MITFDRVLPELIRICHEDLATRDVVTRYCVVRDVRGRVRLIADPRAPSTSLETLESALVAALGAYFVPTDRIFEVEVLDGAEAGEAFARALEGQLAEWLAAIVSQRAGGS